jgi:formimidoylglutamate deiminase
MALFERCLDRTRDHPHHALGLALHSLRAVSKAEMDEVLLAERGRAATVHIHIAEQPGEVSQCQAAYGARPVEWLLQNVAVDARWCLVHATHMEAAEYRAAAASGAVAGICPTTEADLGDGFFEAEEWLGQGGHLAIGSDSNLRISPTEELRMLEFGLRLRTGRRNVLAREGMACGESIYLSATRGGGRALGQPVGQLAVGLRADLLELDDAHPMLKGVADQDILDRYVFAGVDGMIRSVFVGGRQVVYKGKHQARDAAAAGFVAVMEELAQ